MPWLPQRPCGVSDWKDAAAKDVCGQEYDQGCDQRVGMHIRWLWGGTHTRGRGRARSMQCTHVSACSNICGLRAVKLANSNFKEITRRKLSREGGCGIRTAVACTARASGRSQANWRRVAMTPTSASSKMLNERLPCNQENIRIRIVRG